MSRSNGISVEQIMQMTDGGRTIIENELNGSVPYKPVNSLIRTNDDSPSMSFFQHSSKWMFKDYGNGESGDAIKLIRLMYNLNYSEALGKIICDLGLEASKNVYNKALSSNKKPDVIVKKDVLIDWDIQPFTKKHTEYFKKYHLEEDYLNENDCWAIRKFAINKHIVNIPEIECSFVYEHRDENGFKTGKCKILNLGAKLDPKHKWKTTLNNNILWREHTIPKDCKNLFIVKSQKDSFVLNKHLGLNCVSVQNEDPMILLQNNYEKLEAMAENKIVAFGCDNMGWHSSYLITYLTNWNYFNIPNNLYDYYQIEDFSDYVEYFGIKSLQNLYKLKKHL